MKSIGRHVSNNNARIRHLEPIFAPETISVALAHRGAEYRMSAACHHEIAVERSEI